MLRNQRCCLAYRSNWLSLAADQLAGLLRLAIGRWLEVESDGSSYPCSSAGRITLEGLEAKGTRSKAVKPVVRGRLCCHPLLLLLLLQGPAES